MKHLLVGLGNPGDKYRNNRHNAGFMFIDYLVKRSDSEELKNEKKFEAEIGEISLKGRKSLVAKPQSFMNRSGDVVRQIADFYKINVENIIIIHDDLDIPIGKYKVQSGTSPQLHNGITSIDKSLGTREYTRVRIGIENRGTENRPSGEDYVLSDFTLEERQVIEDLFPQIFDKI